MLLGVMGTIFDDDQAHALTRQLLDALPSGSYLVFEDGTNTIKPDAAAEAGRLHEEEQSYSYRLRTPDEIARFFDGLELVDPGVVSVSRWRVEVLGVRRARRGGRVLRRGPQAVALQGVVDLVDDLVDDRRSRGRRLRVDAQLVHQVLVRVHVGCSGEILRAGDLLEVDHVVELGLGEAQDGDGADPADVPAVAERKHLDGDVRRAWPSP